MKPKILAAHTNSEGERITVEEVQEGRFTGKILLVIHDDAPSTTCAPMLLDAGTRVWLRKHLTTERREGNT